MTEIKSSLQQALIVIEQLDAQIEEMRSAATQPLAIVGAACRFPDASTPEAFWANLEAGHNSVREIKRDRWDVDKYYDPNPDAPGKVSTRWGGFLDSVREFDAEFFGISPREAEYTDPQHRMFLEVAWEAIESARMTRGMLAGSATGVFAAVCFHDYDRMMVENFDDIVAYTITGGAPSMLANRLSYLLDLHGPSLTIDTACSSSLVAVHLACESLRAGNCDAALVGGVNLLLDPATTIAASKFRMMSPVGRCKTFDASADGFVRGEGCGVVVLKRLSDALAAGDEVLAIIRGTAVNQDGRTNGLTAPNGRAQEAVIRAALRDAGVAPAAVGYVETHGTGTPLGDPIEVEALMRVYGEGRVNGEPCQLGAVKTNIGHLEAAAGIAGLIKATLALRHGRVPRNLNLETLNPEIDTTNSCFRFPSASVEWSQWPRFAGASSFGFGGTNAHVILEAAPISSPRSAPSEAVSVAPMLVPISARSPAALQALVEAYQKMAASASPSVPELAAALALSRTHMDHRLALVAESSAELGAQLAAVLVGQHVPGVFRGQARSESLPVVFVFPGQGSQWFGMGRELFQHEPAFRSAFEACSEAVQQHTCWSLVDELFANAEHSRMASIEVVQPLLFAVSVSLAALWRARGIEPDFVVGHSMGEVAAAYVAGALTLSDAALVISMRSKLMSRLRSQGEMLATELTLDEARVLVRDHAQKVSVAASNGAKSTVLSGDREAMASIFAQLTEREVFCRRIEVDVASHSPAVDALRSDLLLALQRLQPRASDIPMYSTVTGLALDGEELNAAYWFDNLRQPVLFYQVIEGLLDNGVRALVECSPHPVLLPAVQENTTARSVLAVSSLRRKEPELRAMLESLAALHVQGLPVRWEALHGDSKPHVSLPTYPWQRESFWFSERSSSSKFRSGLPQRGGSRARPTLGSWVQPAHDSAAHWLQVMLEDGIRGEVSELREACTELALEGVRELDPKRAWSLQNVAFADAESGGSPGGLDLQLMVTTAEDRWQVQVSARSHAGGATTPWRLVLTADAHGAALQLSLASESTAVQGLPVHSLRTQLLSLSDAKARQELLEVSIREHVGRAMKLAAHRIDLERKLELDSLMAMQIRVALQADLGLEVPLARLLRGGSPRSLAEFLLLGLQVSDDAPTWLSDSLPSIVPQPEERHETFELTDLQQAYWLGRSGTFALGRVATYFFVEVDVDDIDLTRLGDAWNALVARHPMLRAEFLVDGRQRVRASVPRYEIELTDLSNLADSDRELELAALREVRSRRVFAGDQWPLFELKASKLDQRFTRLHIGLDILIVDGWSISTLFREWRELYHSADTILPELGVDFRDYVVAGEAIRRTALYERSLGYWKERAKTLPEAPKLALRNAPQSEAAPKFFHRTTLMAADKWASFKAHARAAGVTPSTAIGTAYCEVLAAWSSERHFTLNLLFFNRLPLHPQIEDVVGNFSTTMLLEVDLREPSRFGENAQKVQTALTECLDNSLVNGVEVLRQVNRLRGWSGDAAMPVVFASALDIEGVDAAATRRLDVAANLKALGSSSRMVGSSLRTPQVYLDHQIYEEHGALRLNWDSLDALFPEGALDSMWSAYLHLLDRLALSSTAWEEIARIGMTPAVELVERTNANARTAPCSNALLHSGFLAMAQKQPDALAVVSATLNLSYRQLEERATVLGHRLLDKQLAPGELVAVFCAKGWEQVVAVIAIHMAGGAYLPMDPALPDQRVQWLIEHGQARIVIGNPEQLARIDGAQVLEISEAALKPGVGELKPLTTRQAPSDLAYVIYTSGSTGTPKGVAVSHRAAMNTIEDVNLRFELSTNDRAFAISSLSFDLSVYDIFGLLAVGGAVVVPEPAQLRAPAEWLALIETSGTSVWSSVPALVEMLVEHCESVGRMLPESLRLVMMSGDWIPVALPERIAKVCPGAKVVSLGGATEAAIWSIWYPIEGALPGWSSIPYGYPMLNQQFHVLDSHLEPCPRWVSGELFIAGEGLAMKYWQDEARTAERFIVHPRTGVRMYRTGDLGRYRAQGLIEFQGRNDFQVKVQGYRIELGEVEAVLASHPDVRSCVAVVKGGRADAKSLVAYWVRGDQSLDSIPDLRSYLAERLPSYMVPSAFVQLEALPLSSNGKVDRGALPDHTAALGARAARESIAPRTALELELHGLWADLLGTPAFGVTDGFFELGGHSLLAMRLINRMNGRFKRAYPMSLLFTCNTIEKLALHVEEGSGASWSPTVALRAAGNLQPFFCVHPVGGNVLCYRGLAEHLSPERPFFGLQARGLVPGLTAHGTIEDAAKDYVSAIRAVQPSGPYYLGGWSLGGVIAFEMAQQLVLQGERVQQVVMLDSRLPGGGRQRSEAELLCEFGMDMARLSGASIAIEVSAVLAYPEPERFAYVLGLLKAAGALSMDIETSELDSLWETYRMSLTALDRYLPGPYAGSVTILRAELQPAAENAGKCMGWERYVNGPLSAESVSGDHYSLLEPQHWPVLAGLIDKALETVAYSDSSCAAS